MLNFNKIVDTINTRAYVCKRSSVGDSVLFIVNLVAQSSLEFLSVFTFFSFKGLVFSILNSEHMSWSTWLYLHFYDQPVRNLAQRENLIR